MKRDDPAATYYDVPAVKPTPFEWHTAAYLVVSGTAGAAAMIAALAERFGPARLRSVVTNARALAFCGAVVGPLLLVRDLKTPRRWYNMLRIFRRTSSMSIGSYILTAFGATNAAAALAQRLSARRTARALGVPAAAAGAGMLTYTGALFAATSTPVWAAQSPLMSARLASSGIACGAAALRLCEALSGRMRNAQTLEPLAIAATATYALVDRRAHMQAREAGVAEPLEGGASGTLRRVGSVLTIGVPLACHVLALVGPRRSRALTIVSALSLLAGAAISRYADLEAGKASANRAADYLRFTAAERRD